MTILTLRTDKPEAEIGLYDEHRQITYQCWIAHRQLAETLHGKINDIFKSANMEQSGLDGIVIFSGPGSFTGLRIGMAVTNALAYALDISVISSGGENWLSDGINDLVRGKGTDIALPEYGSPALTTLPHAAGKR